MLTGTVDQPRVEEQEYLALPEGSRPEQLAWVRREVLEIMERTKPKAVAYKAIEGSAQTKDPGRAEVEGVFQEAVFSAGVIPLRRVKRQIKADVGFEGSARYVDRALSALPKLPSNRRESALAALVALAHA